jgi:hypothetical protein
MKQKTSKGFVVFDIETLPDKKHNNALLGDCCYISYCDRDGVRGFPSTDLTAFFLNTLLTEQYASHIIYAHNGFRFDYKRLSLRRLAEAGFTGKIIKDKAHNYKSIELEKDGLTWWLQDTAVKFPASLKDLLKTFAPHLPKGDLNFNVETFDVNNSRHTDYAKRDSEGLYFAVERIDALFQDYFGISFHDRPTAPGLSLMAFKAFCKAEKVKYPTVTPATEPEIRDSYYGGQTLALDCNWHDDVIAIDLHSSYGAAMLNTPMPYGNCITYRPFHQGVIVDEVLYAANVYVPPGVFPSLKSTALIDGKRKKGNIAGYISGKWWGKELNLAKKFGAKIEQITQAWEWTETSDILQRFIFKLKKLRDEKGTPQDKIGKLLQNSLYGRFAQGEIEEDTILTLAPPDSASATYDPESDSIVPFIWTIPHDNSRDRLAPIQWGSWITCLGRCALNEAILIKPEAVLYCDTDSVFMSRADFPAFEHLLGPDYGQWGLEEDKSGRFKAYGPKAYFTAGKRINKGIPRNRFQQMRDAKAEQLKKEGVEFTDLYLDNYIATINTVTYVQFKGLHHVQQGATFGDSQDRRTACPEKISVGLFDIDGRWHPENAQPADCKKSHAS